MRRWQQKRASKPQRLFSFEPLERRSMLALTVSIDYSLDTNNFFDTQAKKDLLQYAANSIASMFSDELSAITPGGGNTWTAYFFDPATGAEASVVDMEIATNEIIVFAGGRDLGSDVVGLGGPGGFSSFGFPDFNDALAYRGQAGASDPAPTDFGPWGGSITFSTNSGTTWHFGETTTGLDAGEDDFYSVALHEFAHLFGFGTAASWYTYVDASTNSFSGPASVEAYDGTGNVPLDPPVPAEDHDGLAHWLDGTTDEGVETAMDPVVTTGTRKLMTELDFAGLVDVGWELGQPDISIQQVTANGFTTLIVNYTIVNGPVAPFDLSFYRSTDSTFGSDTLLDTIAVTDASSLTTGVHVLNLTLGSGTNEIAFPGAGVSDTNDDDFLLAVIDPSNLVEEADAHPTAEDNTAVFEGVYHLNSAGVYVWGSANNDTVLVEKPSDVKVTYNGTSYTYTDSSVTSVRIRGKSGDDSIDGTTITKTLWLHGGDGHDGLKGGNAADTIVGGAGNDALEGRAGDDLYSFDSDMALGEDTVLETTGQDKLDFSSTSTKSIVLNLGLTSKQTVNSNLKLTLQAGGAVEHLTGGDLNDQLTGNGEANTLSGRGGNDTLSGSSNNDLYLFDTDIALGSDTVIDSSGIDLLDFSSTTTLGVTVNIGITTAQVVNTNLTLTLTSATSIENILGGALNDNLTGNSLQNILRGNAGNDTLAGAAGNDTYQFDTDSSLGSDSINDSAGTDLIDFTGTTTQSVSVDLNLTSAQVVNPNLTLTLSSGSSIENVTGGSLNDVLRGNSLANQLNGSAGNDLLEGFAGNDTLTGSAGDDTCKGGAGNDTYSFSADSTLGSDSLDETGGSGTDTVSFSTTTTAVAADLSQTTAQVVNAFLTISLSSATHFENLVGGSGADTLTGNTLVNNISGGNGNDTVSGLVGNDVLNGDGGDDLLIGGSGNDTYNFDADLSLGVDTLDESGGGTDLLSFTATTTIGVAVDLSLATVQVVNPNLSLVLGSGTTLENLTGGSGNDTLIGNDLANSVIGNPGNDTIHGGMGNDVLTGSAGNDSLLGGGGNDIYTFVAQSALGTDTLDESGGGIDTLSFASTTTKAVTVDLSASALQVVNEFLSLILSSDTTFENAIGGSLADTLTGNSLANSLTGNSGNDVLVGGAGSDSLTGGVGNDALTGGADADYYLFDADSQLGTDTINESGGGTDTLDFSTTGSLAITVDLSQPALQAVNANLQLVLGSGTDVENMFGGTKNDTITGNALHNILLGGAGNDSIYGGAGRDLLLGGIGADFLRGDDDEDILVAGATSHDANAAALAAILAEWTSANDYATRTSRLRTGDAGVMLKAGTTATNDSSVDNLDGLAATDWYFAAAADTVAALEPGELKESL